MSKPKSRHHHQKPSKLPHILAIGGLAIIILAIVVAKDPIVDIYETKEAQLDHALNNHQPILAFFHSNNCQQCLIMIDTVNRVFPDFSSSVVLVEINAYDPKNRGLLQRVGLQYIPTLIFYDRQGQVQTYVGVLEADSLRQTLSSLVEGE